MQGVSETQFDELSLDQLKEYQRPVPRYTSYPTSPLWQPLDPYEYSQRLLTRSVDDPVSLYIHVPFCRSMCLFCGCHVILNRREDVRRDYALLLEREIELVCSKAGKLTVSQIHLGGGTPTYMPLECLRSWLKLIDRHCQIRSDAEISIEIDPRSVIESGREKLDELFKMGFNRISFGVQDTDEAVQEAIHRRQSASVSEQTLMWAREVGFKGINIDLIYGLPLQTERSFTQTAEKIASWRPSRIALFSYAKVHWLKEHQKAIPDSLLPSDSVKLTLYLMARQLFIKAGYIAIGMDHFALPTDELAQAYLSGNLQRNFQGYALKLSEELIGLGVSSTGFVGDLYVQNVKEIETYRERLERGLLATFRGIALNHEDRRRRWVIQRLMCDFKLIYAEYASHFQRDFHADFPQEMREMESWSTQQMLKLHPDQLVILPKGRIFVRLLAACFDAYLKKEASKPRFSMSI